MGSKLSNLKKDSHDATTTGKGKPVITVLYGSQHGTAEGFAKTLVASAQHTPFTVRAMDLAKLNPSTLPKMGWVIFVVATFGDGGPTDSAVKFHKYLTDTSLPLNCMNQVKFTVFGLGNKTYATYNGMGRMVNSRMEKLGAHRVYRHGEGNDEICIDNDFDDWRQGLWDALAAQLAPSQVPRRLAPTAKTAPPCFEFDVLSLHPKSKLAQDPVIVHGLNYSTATLVNSRELRQSTSSGSTLHLEFDIKNTGVSYATADNLAILPENDPALVSRVATALRFDEDGVVELKPLDKTTKLPFPTPATIRTILSRYLDLNAAPRKGALAALAHYATSADEQDKLLRLASVDGKTEYQTWVVDACRTYGDVIEAFPSLQIPLAAFVHILPSLQPRYYTISSSSRVHPTRIHVTLGVIASELPGGRRFKGVTSNFLANLSTVAKRLQVPPVVRATIRKSMFKLPASPSTPVIMVGPGTGIAPMRAFLQERHAQKEAGENVGATWLFFGCRRQAEDYLYKDELEAYRSSGTLTDLHVAFSRDTPQKVYVQHLIEQHGAALWKALSVGGHVYVCGATLMGTDVHKAFVELVQTHGGKSQADAAAFVQDLQHHHRYVQELWA
ncbi:hypothetical protein H310_06794 [Aphanomyces invadans]|uniref:NADPH--hemoprotein reductase n=1 Tax=Aphanomyces invadans TaxID=157072 RepID=A0A024U6F9_9STRA|nr:hypothetical protein H310_06794 [Aphanomyces invadans]ETW01203.1 hypothetical protein H310_06794 [Aphanomyces invadans]|eukprot:XP_008870201.1 hypothetical protein H310_06794 [Aphanomyces invadans]